MTYLTRGTTASEKIAICDFKFGFIFGDRTESCTAKNEVLYNYYGHLSHARKFEVRAKFCGNTVCFYYARTR